MARIPLMYSVELQSLLQEPCYLTGYKDPRDLLAQLDNAQRLI